MSKLLAKLMIETDTHLRETDFTSMKGYVHAVEAVQFDLQKAYKNHKIDYVISTGDLFHSGYSDQTISERHKNIIREKARLVNFNMVIGNHLYLNMDNNPELHLMQPHDHYQTMVPTFQSDAIIKTPNEIVIGPAQFSLMHNHKFFNMPAPVRKEGISMHVAVTHCEKIFPPSVARELGEFKHVPDTQAFADCDLIVAGHLHTKVGMMEVNGVSILGPGALCVTANDENQKHTYVDLPIFLIYEDRVEMEFYRQSLHLELIKFKGVKTSIAETMEINGEIIDIVPDKTAAFRTHIGMHDFMKNKGLSDKAIDFLYKCSENTATVTDVIKIATKETVKRR